MSKLLFQSSAALAHLTFAAMSSVAPSPELERVRRAARLFVAGEYPDKGCSVTTDDLDLIITRFNTGGGKVPIKSEHMDSPMDPLGDVVALHREGDELFGMLSFSAGIDAHLRERGVEHLSIALQRVEASEGAGYVLTETSLVLRPRVSSAGFLSPAVQKQLAHFRANGQVTQAMEPSLGRLLAVPAVVQFGDGSSIDVAAEVAALIASMPVLQPRTPVGVPVAFSASVGVASAASRSMAAGLGVPVERLHAALKKGSD